MRSRGPRTAFRCSRGASDAEPRARAEAAEHRASAVRCVPSAHAVAVVLLEELHQAREHERGSKCRIAIRRRQRRAHRSVRAARDQRVATATPLYEAAQESLRHRMPYRRYRSEHGQRRGPAAVLPHALNDSDTYSASRCRRSCSGGKAAPTASHHSCSSYAGRARGWASASARGGSVKSAQ